MDQRATRAAFDRLVDAIRAADAFAAFAKPDVKADGVRVDANDLVSRLTLPRDVHAAVGVPEGHQLPRSPQQNAISLTGSNHFET